MTPPSDAGQEDPCAPLQADAWTIGQMGQSLDGFIATRTGASHYVTGAESLVHLHRLRALADAVVVGWKTVESDDPRLTVRRVEGPDPARVVVDLRGELGAQHAVFRGGAPAALVLAQGTAAPEGLPAHVELLRVEGERVEPTALVHLLQERGWRRILVEGGGALVSSFLNAGALDRLHLVVAPLLIGQGRPGVQPTPVDDLAQALRPPARTFPMGPDVLFDLDFSSTT